MILDLGNLRDGSVQKDRAILDVLHLKQLGLISRNISVRQLKDIWKVSQSQVSRRMSAIGDLEGCRVESNYGFYRVTREG